MVVVAEELLRMQICCCASFPQLLPWWTPSHITSIDGWSHQVEFHSQPHKVGSQVPFAVYMMPWCLPGALAHGAAKSHSMLSGMRKPGGHVATCQPCTRPMCWHSWLYACCIKTRSSVAVNIRCEHVLNVTSLGEVDMRSSGKIPWAA